MWSIGVGTAIRGLLLGIGGMRGLMFMLGVDLAGGGGKKGWGGWRLACSRFRVCGTSGGRWP